MSCTTYERFQSTVSTGLLFAAMLLWGVPTHAGKVADFHANLHDARWQVVGSVFECRMVQQIPGLGEAVFYHEAGEALSFHLQATDSPMQQGRALLTSLPPAWRSELRIRDLGYVDIDRSARPLMLDESRSRVLLAELDRGMMPTVIRRAWYADDESIRVGLSPVNFTPVKNQYHACVGELLPVNFSQVERSTVFWQPNQQALNASQRAQLDDIVRYALADPGVYSFEINGFTDSAGTPRQNLELSRSRAFAVHEYLVSRGVAESMLATRYFGSVAEYRIIRDERSAADRDRNRRVTIRIRREGPYPPVTDR